MRGPVVGGLALAVLVGGACESPRDCTLIGSDPSHVGLVVPDLDWRIVELCVDGECEADGWVPVRDDPATYGFTVSVVDPGGRTIERSGEITTVEVRPNGEGCPPRASTAAVVVQPDGTVTTEVPRSPGAQ